jgi:biopolymer transport protein TolR
MSKRGEEKEMNFELNLLPIISMMSVCICFLLLTAVWTQIGSVNIDQGLGQESTRVDQKAPSLWVMMKSGGRVEVKVMDSPQMPSELRDKSFVVGSAGSGWIAVEKHAAQVKRAMPGLKTALIMPEARVNYGDVIHIMDRLKTLEIGEIGVAPL